MKANEMTVDDRAAAGAAWLDDVYPEWWRVVDLDLLDMGSGCRCVVGQTFTPDPAIEDDDLLRESGFDALLWTTAHIPGRTKKDLGGWQIHVQAGDRGSEHIVPPAGEDHAFDRRLWAREVTVYVSATGRSVRVFVDGEEVKP